MKIARAARKLFMQDGYAVTSIKAIAAEAGVSEPTVYARSRNKRSIVEAMVDEMDNRAGVLDLIEALRASTGDVDAQLDMIVEFDLRLFGQDLDVFLAASQASSSEPELTSLLEEGKARGRAGRARVLQAWPTPGR